MTTRISAWHTKEDVMFTLIGSRDKVVYIYSPDTPGLLNCSNGYFVNGLHITPEPHQCLRDTLFDYDADNVREHINNPLRDAVNQ